MNLPLDQLLLDDNFSLPSTDTMEELISSSARLQTNMSTMGSLELDNLTVSAAVPSSKIPTAIMIPTGNSRTYYFPKYPNFQGDEGQLIKILNCIFGHYLYQELNEQVIAKYECRKSKKHTTIILYRIGLAFFPNLPQYPTMHQSKRAHDTPAFISTLES